MRTVASKDAYVIGNDYFAGRFTKILSDMGVKATRFSAVPKSISSERVFFSGEFCTYNNVANAIDAGADVFSEQLIFSTDDSHNIFSKARNNGQKLCLWGMDIINPAIACLPGIIGHNNIRNARVDRVGPVSHSKINIIDDSAMHGIALLSYVFCSGFNNSNHSVLLDGAHQEFVSDHSALLTFADSGKHASVYCDSKINYKERSLAIIGDKIRIVVDMLRQKVLFLNVEESDKNICDSGLWNYREHHLARTEPLAVLIKQFVTGEANATPYRFMRNVFDMGLRVKSV